MASKNSIQFDLLAKDVSVTKTFNKVEKGAKSFRAGLGKLAAGIGIAFAVREIVDFGTESVHQFAAAQESQKRLAFAFSKFPALANTNQVALQKLNSELQKKTRYDDDAIAAAQANLAQFKLTGEQLTEVTPLLLDYASATGKDVTNAATDVGKALLGNAKALKTIGISYKATGDQTKDYTNITALLREQVGGFAEKDAQTAQGKLEILQNRFGEIQETIGGALMPAFDDVLNWLEGDGMEALEGFVNDGIVPGIDGIIDLAGQIVEYKDILGPAAIALGALTAAQWLLNVAMDANPVGAVILALEALVGLGALVVMNWESIAPALANGGAAVALAYLDISKSIAGALEGVVNMAIDGINTFLNAVNGVRAALGMGDVPLVGKVDFTSQYKSARAGVIGWRNTLSTATWENGMFNPHVYGTTGKSKPSGRVNVGGDKVNVGAFAAGGIVTSETLALIGEAGETEIVTPLSQLPAVAAAAGIGSTSGGQFTGNLYLDGGGLLGIVRGEIRAADARNVRTSKMGKRK